MQIEEGNQMKAEVDNFLSVADPDVSLKNGVLCILTFNSKPDLSYRNCNKGSCVACCIGTIGQKLFFCFFFRTTLIIRIFTFHNPHVSFPIDLLMTLFERTPKSKL